METNDPLLLKPICFPNTNHLPLKKLNPGSIAEGANVASPSSQEELCSIVGIERREILSIFDESNKEMFSLNKIM